MPELRRRTRAAPATREVNYRHAYHAGNFADVVKHVALAAVIVHLKKKEKPFCVIDSHAGRGLYDLAGEEARRTGEADQGIARLAGMDRSAVPASLAAYLDCVRAEGEGRYPGSPRLAARLLRAQDRLIAVEKHADEAAALSQALAPFANARAVEADGYDRLPALLPPKERRGVVLIDPPFEAVDEFARVCDLLARARDRFATGIFLLWFPIKSKAQADALSGELLARGPGRAARLDIAVGGHDERLNAAGLLIVNPPFGFAPEMASVAKILAPRLGRGKSPAEISLSDLR